MLAEYVVFLHILFMFAGVAAADGVGFLVFRIVASRDVGAMRTTYRIVEPLNKSVPLLFVAGLIFGLIAVFSIGFNPFEPWLIIAYVLFVLQVAISTVFIEKWHKRVHALAEAPDADPNSGELAAALADRSARTASLVQIVLIGVFIFDMVVKPFSNRVL